MQLDYRIPKLTATFILKSVIALAFWNLLVIGILSLDKEYGLYGIIILFSSALGLGIYLLAKQSTSVILLALGITPFIWLNDAYNYSLMYVLILDIPVLLFILYSVMHYLFTSDTTRIRLTYLQKGLMILFGYILFMTVFGVLNKGRMSIIFNEFYHGLIYVIAFLIFNLLRSREEYHKLFKFLLIASVIVAFEYIAYNIYYGRRFTTFHNAFLSAPAGIFFSGIIMYRSEKRKRFLFSAGLALTLIASVLVQARSLWLAILLSFFAIIVTYIINYTDKTSRVKLISILSLLIFIPLSIYFYKSDGGSSSAVPENVSQRVQSISNPLEDISFLMRLEIGYYALHKFLASPIVGEGYGKPIKFKLLADTEVVFFDNSWLYFLVKGGLIGFFIYLLVYYRFLKTGLMILRLTKEDYVKWMVLGIFGGFTGFLIYGILSANLIGYKMNLFYALFFAYFDYEYTRLKPVE